MPGFFNSDASSDELDKIDELYRAVGVHRDAIIANHTETWLVSKLNDKGEPVEVRRDVLTLEGEKLIIGDELAMGRIARIQSYSLSKKVEGMSLALALFGAISCMLGTMGWASVLCSVIFSQARFIVLKIMRWKSSKYD